MSNATVTADAVDESTTTEAEAPAAGMSTEPGCEGGRGCVCSAEVGHVFGGLPYVLEVTMSVAGMPPVTIVEARGKVGKVVAGPAFYTPSPTLDGKSVDGGPEIVGVRALEVIAPTHGEIYRATAEQLEGMTPDLFRLADEADAKAALGFDDDEADEGGDVTRQFLDQVPVERCCRQAAADAERAAQAAGCPGPSGPLAEPVEGGEGEAGAADATPA